MKRRLLPLFFVLLAAVLVGCEPPQEFPPGFTDIDRWERFDIRIDTEVPDQYPHGRSDLDVGADDHEDALSPNDEPADEEAH